MNAADLRRAERAYSSFCKAGDDRREMRSILGFLPEDLPPRKRKTVVKTFMPRFAPLVEDGTKRQTVRPRPKRIRDYPSAGDRFSGRMWSGRPYASKQRLLREGVITEVRPIEISALGIRIGNQSEYLTHAQENRFARADGFEDYSDMRKWFMERYKTTFSGFLIKWRPDNGKVRATLKCHGATLPPCRKPARRHSVPM